MIVKFRKDITIIIFLQECIDELFNDILKIHIWNQALSKGHLIDYSWKLTGKQNV